jgi:hypothetical protein
LAGVVSAVVGVFKTAAAATATFAASHPVLFALGKAAVAYGINAALAPDVPPLKAQLEVQVGTTEPRSMLMGRTCTAGFAITPQMYSGADNGIGSFIRGLSFAGKTGTIEAVIYDDEVKAVSGSAGSIIYNNNSRWFIYNQGAWNQSALSIAAGGAGLAGGGQPTEWTSSHRCLGITTAWHLFGLYNPPVREQGIPRDIKHVVDCDAVDWLIDPRTGTTATGAALYNPFVWCYSFLRGCDTLDGVNVAGLNVSATGIHTASFSAAANNADTNTFTIGGQAVLEKERAWETARAMAQAGGGDITLRGTQIYATYAASKSVVAYISEEDLLGEIKHRPIMESSQKPNGIIPRFLYENNDGFWNVIDGTLITDASFVTADGGREKITTIEFPFCGGNDTQAGKLAALALVNNREPTRYSIPLKTQGRYYAMVGDCVEFDTPDRPYDGVKLLVESVSINPDLSVTLEAVTETDSKYAWALGQTTTPPELGKLPDFDRSYCPAPASGDWSVAADTITSNGAEIPILRLSGASDYANAQSIVVRYKLASGGTWVNTLIFPPDSTTAEITGITPDTAYIVGVSYINPYGVEGSILELSSATTDALIIDTPQIQDNAVSDGDSVYGTAAMDIAYNLNTVPWTGSPASWTEVDSVTLTTTGKKVAINGSINFKGSPSGSVGIYFYYRIKCDGTVVHSPWIVYSMWTAVPDGGAVPVFFRHLPSAGSHTYTLEACCIPLSNVMPAIREVTNYVFDVEEMKK